MISLHVDFNYGGVQGSTGVVYLSPKVGHRSGIATQVQRQLDAAGLTAEVALKVRLVEYANDEDESGEICDIEADGTLQWIDDGHGWRAIYESDSWTLVPVRRRRAEDGTNT